MGRTQAEISEARRRAVAVVTHLFEIEGLGYAAIAHRTGIPIATIAHYRHDPTGAKRRERRAQWRGECEICGAATTGDSPVRTRRRCPVHADRQRRWDRVAILQALAGWERAHGTVPSSSDLRRVTLAGDRRWPSYAAVQRAFGTFQAGVDAYYDYRSRLAMEAGDDRGRPGLATVGTLRAAP